MGKSHFYIQKVGSIIIVCGRYCSFWANRNLVSEIVGLLKSKFDLKLLGRTKAEEALFHAIH